MDALLKLQLVDLLDFLANHDMGRLGQFPPEWWAALPEQYGACCQRAKAALDQLDYQSPAQKAYG